MEYGFLGLMIHDEQMLRGIIAGSFSTRGAMLVIRWLVFLGFGRKRLESSCRFIVFARRYVPACGSMSGIASHEAKVCHFICGMMQAVMTPYVQARAGQRSKLSCDWRNDK